MLAGMGVPTKVHGLGLIPFPEAPHACQGKKPNNWRFYPNSPFFFFFFFYQFNGAPGSSAGCQNHIGN